MVLFRYFVLIFQIIGVVLSAFLVIASYSNSGKVEEWLRSFAAQFHHENGGTGRNFCLGQCH